MQDYKIWDVRKKREIITGLFPCAASSGGAVSVRLHDPIEHCIVTFLVACQHDWPYIPKAESLQDDGYVLVHSEQIAHIPSPTSGGRLYTVSGFYVYTKEGAASPPSSDLKTGVVPGDTGLGQDDAVLKSAYFQLGLIQSNYFNNNPQYPPT